MKHFSTLALAFAGASLIAAPVASAAPDAPTSTVTSPASASADARSLVFHLTSARAVDDASYGHVVEATFTVTNTGTSDGPFSFHVLTPGGKNFIDDEGEEMWTRCDGAVSALRPGATTTCRTLIRMSGAEKTAGRSVPQDVMFQWGTSGPTFAGFTVPAVTIGGGSVTPSAPAPADPPAPAADDRGLEFTYVTAAAKDDDTYGSVVEVAFDVKNTGTTPGPWEFHVLTADGKNFLDDEGEEMWAGCTSAMSQLAPGESTRCRAMMRLTKEDIATGESPAMPVTFRWGSSGPTFPGFTVPVLRTAHLGAPAPSEPEPAAPTTSSPAPTPSAPAESPKPSEPAPTTDSPATTPSAPTEPPKPGEVVTEGPAPASTAPVEPPKPSEPDPAAPTTSSPAPTPSAPVSESPVPASTAPMTQSPAPTPSAPAESPQTDEPGADTPSDSIKPASPGTAAPSPAAPTTPGVASPMPGAPVEAHGNGTAPAVGPVVQTDHVSEGASVTALGVWAAVCTGAAVAMRRRRHRVG